CVRIAKGRTCESPRSKNAVPRVVRVTTALPMLQRRQGRNYKCRRLCGMRKGIEQDARLADTGDRFDATSRARHSDRRRFHPRGAREYACCLARQENEAIARL